MSAPDPGRTHPVSAETSELIDQFIEDWIAPVALNEAEQYGSYATPLTPDQQAAHDAEIEHDAERDQ